MLQIKNICKQYETGGFIQKALDGVSLNLRDNEFVAILGPSGSGKTTLLNIIGGLDRYDSGDLIINGISTKRYKDRDWDSYRNHTIGFVFQSYNLIPHQTVLANVELALTISGISKSERRRRAKEALEEVGLGQQLHKKPNQMSGGQMQRVAIARALVNDPDILLADEPTGALDSETSVQVMELLKEVAKDRLVVMVTHNPELAEAYATRIVNLKDGVIQSDSHPFEVDDRQMEVPVHKNMGKSSMSFLTSLALSFNNLRTKKARTLLTSFAGSIGIIGIALILAISNGVNGYIKSIEETTLSEYPLQIQRAGMNMASMMPDSKTELEEDADGKIQVSQMITGMLSTVDPNDLASLKGYLESGNSGIENYVNAIEYSYDVSPQIYRMEKEGIHQVHPDKSFASLGMGSEAGSNSFMSMMMSTDVFFEMPENEDLYKDQYDIKAGRWPENYNECVVVLTQGGSMSDFMLYTLGLRDHLELEEMIDRFIDEESVEMPEDIRRPHAYDELIGIEFKLVNGADYYEYDKEYRLWKDKTDDNVYMRRLIEKGEDLRIVGVVQPSEDAAAAMLSFGIGYLPSLTQHVIETAQDRPIVKDQLRTASKNVLTGETFGKERGEKVFQLEDMFTIDEEGLKKAFNFDMGALDLSGFDFSSQMDFENISLDLSEFPEIDFGDLMPDLEFEISSENIYRLVEGLVQGYSDYAVQHPEADYSGLGESFLTYMQLPETRQMIQQRLNEILKTSLEVTVSKEQLQQLIENVMMGYQEYAIANGWTDPTKFNEYLMMYLQIPEVQQRIAEEAAGIFQIEGDFELTQEQLELLAADIVEGYHQYAVNNGLPDPWKMGDHFNDYLETPSAQEQLMNGVSEMIHMGELDFDSNTLYQSLEQQMSGVMAQITGQIGSKIQNGMTEAMTQFGSQIENAFHMDTEAFINSIQMNMNEEEMTELLRSMMSAENTSYEGNLKKFGYADLDHPSQIDIYPMDFESKGHILEILDRYNDHMRSVGEEEKVITYNDLVGTLMASVTEIVDIISYVLVAFVAISLVVSSIMIGVITYISVLERKKEIGILRAIGASKGNISQVFNAETFIIGFCAGLIGIGLTLLLLIPGNAIIHSLAGTTDVNAYLPPVYALLLVALSVFLTLLGGIIPSRKAAKSDPVAALRSE